MFESVITLDHSCWYVQYKVNNVKKKPSAVFLWHLFHRVLRSCCYKNTATGHWSWSASSIRLSASVSSINGESTLQNGAENVPCLAVRPKWAHTGKLFRVMPGPQLRCKRCLLWLALVTRKCACEWKTFLFSLTHESGISPGTEHEVQSCRAPSVLPTKHSKKRLTLVRPPVLSHTSCHKLCIKSQI